MCNTILIQSAAICLLSLALPIQIDSISKLNGELHKLEDQENEHVKLLWHYNGITLLCSLFMFVLCIIFACINYTNPNVCIHQGEAGK
jgi:hypothetical protein